MDGDAGDVDTATRRYGMEPYWNYLGHRYSRAWVRELQADQAVLLEMTLLAPPTLGVLTAEPAPAITGNTLRWAFQAGDVVRFFDGRARPSLRRLNSYIGVDRIRIATLPGAPRAVMTTRA